MYAAEKRDIIEAINEIRESIGLKPYDAEQLSEMDVDELKNLYRAQKKLKEVSETPVEELEKPVEEAEKPFVLPEINLKHVLMVVVPVACISLGLIFYFTNFTFFKTLLGGKDRGEGGGEIERPAAEVSAIISECNALISEILTIDNSCLDDDDCMFTSFCNCANEVTYQDVERIIEKSYCKEFKLTDCSAFTCSCVNGKCAS